MTKPIQDQRTKPTAPATGAPTSNEDPGRTNLRLASGAFVTLGATFFGRVIQLLSQIVFAKMLGVEDYGRFAVGMVVVRLLGSIAPLGMGRAAVIIGSQYWGRDDSRFKGVALATLGTAAIAGMLMGVSAVVAAAAGYRPPAFVDTSLTTQTLFALVVPFFALLRVLMDLTLVSQQVRYRAIAESIAQPTVALFGFVGLYFLLDHLNAAITAVGLSYAASCALGVYFVLTIFRGPLSSRVEPRWDLSSLARFAGPACLAATFGVFHGLLDRLVVGSFLSAADMAVYHAASQGSFAFMMIVGSFGTIFAPMAAAAFAAGDKVGLARLYRTSTKWGLYLGLPLFVLLQLAASPLLGLTFGPSYAAGGPVLSILAFGQIVNVGTGSVGAMLLSSRNQSLWLLSTGAGAVANALVGLTLVGPYGVYGAAAANLAGNVILFGGATAFARYRLGMWPYDRSFWKLLLAAGVALAGGRLVLSLITPNLVGVALVGSVVFSSFALTVWRLGLGIDEQQIWDAVRQRLNRKKFQTSTPSL